MCIEVVPFRRTGREGGCGVVGGDGVAKAAEASQQVGSGGVEGVVGGQVQLVDQVQGGLRPVDFPPRRWPGSMRPRASARGPGSWS